MHNPIGGRLDQSCPVCVDPCSKYGTDCICKSPLSEFCYTDYGKIYDVWWWSAFLICFLGLVVSGCKFLSDVGWLLFSLKDCGHSRESVWASGRMAHSIGPLTPGLVVSLVSLWSFLTYFFCCRPSSPSSFPTRLCFGDT